MFGYVRPLKGELKVREYEEFKAVYCGLCHALKRKCGFRARFIVNYDFTFLAMLLSEKEQCQYQYSRCVASPFKKKCFVIDDPALDIAAEYSVILTYWKLRDSVRDGGFVESLTARSLSLLLYRAYKRASERNAEFAELTKSNLSELNALEKDKCDSIDKIADKFSLILAGAAANTGETDRERVLYHALYQIGRVVYIMDAIDDLREDAESDTYNVLACRFCTQNGELSDADKDEIRLTLTHSVNLIISAFDLLERNAFYEVLENIILGGIPFVADKILKGEWRKASAQDSKALEKTDDFAL